jgi:hypothetical protein
VVAQLMALLTDDRTVGKQRRDGRAGRPRRRSRKEP